MNGAQAAKQMDIFFVDRMMCSDICPCSPVYQTLWQDRFTEKALKDRKRSWQATATPPFTPMNFHIAEAIDANGKPGMGFVSTFEECFNTKIDGQFENLPSNFKDEQSREAYNDFAQKDGIATLKLFENKYTCSGFCDVPMFYFSK